MNKAIVVEIEDTLGDTRCHSVWIRGKGIYYQGVTTVAPQEEDYLCNFAELKGFNNTEHSGIIRFYEARIADSDDLIKKKVENEELEDMLKKLVKELVFSDFIDGP